MTPCRACAIPNSGDPRVADIGALYQARQIMGRLRRRERLVLLIDEIDKADIEFPNDLLLELDRMEFHVYETGQTMRAKSARW